MIHKSNKADNSRRRIYIVTLAIVSLFVISSVGSVTILLQGFSDDDIKVSHGQADARFSSIVTEENGASHIVWHDDRTGSYQIFYNRIVPPDQFIENDNDIQLTESSGDAMYPSLAMDYLRNLHVVWQDDRHGHWDIYYLKLDYNGQTLISAERVTNHSGNSIQPSITIDSNNNAQITWYDDRTGSYELYWDKRVEPDVTPVNLTLAPEEPLNNDPADVEITIQNLGDNDASDVSVEFFVDGAIEGTQMISINANSEQQVIFSWTAVFGQHELRIEVDSEDWIAESNEDNNIAAEYVRIYKISEFSNMSIWANATIRHSVDIIPVTIQEVTDPNPSGTPNDIELFVEYTAENYFDYAYVRIGYDEELLGSIDETTLLMYYWDPYDSEGERWVQVEDSGVNVDEDYVWANVSHFTIFAPLGIPAVNNLPYKPSDPDPYNLSIGEFSI